MADDNRFKGLRDELDKNETEANPENETTTKTSEDTPEEGKGEDAAFPFDATEQKSVYALPETFGDLDDAEFDVQVKLRKDHDVRDVKRREFFDAALQVAAEHPDEVAERILQGRKDDE
jgi:hypothetical protein